MYNYSYYVNEDLFEIMSDPLILQLTDSLLSRNCNNVTFIALSLLVDIIYIYMHTTRVVVLHRNIVRKDFNHC